MRYELATLTIDLFTTPKAVEAIGAWVAAPEARGQLLGCWVSDIGELNKVAVLRAFADDAELEGERERALMSDNPFGCGEILTSLNLERYAPFPGQPEVQAGDFGPVYEVRSYKLKMGGLKPTIDAWNEILPQRTAFSPLTIALYALDGEPRITHIWPYTSLEERSRLRSESVQQKAWPPASWVWLDTDMKSTIYLPTAISPLK